MWCCQGIQIHLPRYKINYQKFYRTDIFLFFGNRRIYVTIYVIRSEKMIEVSCLYPVSVIFLMAKLFGSFQIWFMDFFKKSLQKILNIILIITIGSKSRFISLISLFNSFLLIQILPNIFEESANYKSFSLSYKTVELKISTQSLYDEHST